jgi:carbon monoxide dehydrogenase subunit G
VTAVSASIDIHVPPERVWAVIMDPQHFDDWVTIHRKLGHVDTGEPREGFRVDQTLCLHHAHFKVKWELARMDEPRHVVWEGRGPAGSRALIEERLAPLDGGAWTRFDYHNEYDQPGGILGRMASRVLVQGAAEREAGRSLQKLKALLEDGAGGR